MLNLDADMTSIWQRPGGCKLTNIRGVRWLFQVPRADHTTNLIGCSRLLGQSHRVDEKKWKGKFSRREAFSIYPDVLSGWVCTCGVRGQYRAQVGSTHRDEAKANSVAKTGIIAQNRSCKELSSTSFCCNYGSTKATQINRLTYAHTISWVRSQASRARMLKNTSESYAEKANDRTSKDRASFRFPWIQEYIRKTFQK